MMQESLSDRGHQCHSHCIGCQAQTQDVVTPAIVAAQMEEVNNLSASPGEFGFGGAEMSNTEKGLNAASALPEAPLGEGSPSSWKTRSEAKGKRRSARAIKELNWSEIQQQAGAVAPLIDKLDQVGVRTAACDVHEREAEMSPLWKDFHADSPLAAAPPPTPNTHANVHSEANAHATANSISMASPSLSADTGTPHGGEPCAISQVEDPLSALHNLRQSMETRLGALSLEAEDLAAQLLWQGELLQQVYPSTQLPQSTAAERFRHSAGWLG